MEYIQSDILTVGEAAEFLGFLALLSINSPNKGKSLLKRLVDIGGFTEGHS